MNCETIDSRKLETKRRCKDVRRHKFVQALVHPDMHKALRKLALEQDITLGELLQEVIESYLKKETENYAKRKEIN